LLNLGLLLQKVEVEKLKYSTVMSKPEHNFTIWLVFTATLLLSYQELLLKRTIIVKTVNNS